MHLFLDMLIASHLFGAIITFEQQGEPQSFLSQGLCWINLGSMMDRFRINDGSVMDRLIVNDISVQDQWWIGSGSVMDRFWISDPLLILNRSIADPEAIHHWSRSNPLLILYWSIIHPEPIHHWSADHWSRIDQMIIDHKGLRLITIRSSSHIIQWSVDRCWIMIRSPSSYDQILITSWSVSLIFRSKWWRSDHHQWLITGWAKDDDRINKNFR